jgi:hypothetical protein
MLNVVMQPELSVACSFPTDVRCVRPPAALQFAGPFVKECPAIVRAALRWNPQNLMYLTKKQRAEPHLVRIAMESPFGLWKATAEKVPMMVLQHVAPELRLDAHLVKQAVIRCGYELQWASPELREDKLIVLWACAPMTLKVIPSTTISAYYKKPEECHRMKYRDIPTDFLDMEDEVRNILWPKNLY